MGEKPRLLDLYCGAGGTTRGYQQAGFHVTGVDNRPQPRYVGDAFVLADALEYVTAHGADYDAIHASPPCQKFTPLKAMWNRREHPDLIAPTRAALKSAGLPYVIENVPGAPLENPVVLCGSMFALGCAEAELRRHRLFEISPLFLQATPLCNHNWKAETIAVYGHAGGSSNRVRTQVIGVYGGHDRDRRRRTNGQNFSTAARREAMGVDWMTGTELSEAIPPAYTEFVGQWLYKVVRPDV